MATWSICESMDDWWSLNRDARWPGGSSVEGDAEQWVSVAAAIESGSSAGHKRVAVAHRAGLVVLWSPRNCTGERDRQVLTSDEASALAAAIRITLAEAAARTPRHRDLGEDESC